METGGCLLLSLLTNRDTIPGKRKYEASRLLADHRLDVLETFSATNKLHAVQVNVLHSNRTNVLLSFYVSSTRC